jgi:hypothetical protein
MSEVRCVVNPNNPVVILRSRWSLHYDSADRGRSILDRTGSGCIRFNDLKVENATFAEYSCPIRLRGAR